LRTSYKNINYTLTREDTTGPDLVRARALTNTKVEIGFNEDLDASQNFNIEIEDSVAQLLLKVLAREPDKEDAGKLLVYTEPQQEAIYSLQLAAVKGEGEFLQTTFKGVTKADTVSTGKKTLATMRTCN